MFSLCILLFIRSKLILLWEKEPEASRALLLSQGKASLQTNEQRSPVLDPRMDTGPNSCERLNKEIVWGIYKIYFPPTETEKCFCFLNSICSEHWHVKMEWNITFTFNVILHCPYVVLGVPGDRPPPASYTSQSAFFL